MPDDIPFADLIGAVDPIARKAQHPDFAQIPRATRAQLRRRQAAQGTPRTADMRLAGALALNFDDIPAEQFLAMRRGAVIFAKTFDLHGYFVDEGVTLLDDALHARKNRSREIWLVIHGKGRNSPAHDRAPLKHAVIDLLCRHPAVAALCALSDRDHDSGALCIAVHPGHRA